MEGYNKIQAQLRLKELMETFDKTYLKDLFEEGEKMGLFGPLQKQVYKYDHEGYVYGLIRQKMTPFDIMRLRGAL